MRAIYITPFFETFSASAGAHIREDDEFKSETVLEALEKPGSSTDVMECLSKYRREDPVSIAKHKHCLVCGTPIEINKEFCSDKCRMMNRKAARSRTRNLVVITGALLVFLVLFALLRQ